MSRSCDLVTYLHIMTRGVLDGEVKNNLDLTVGMEVNRVTSTKSNQKETANASVLLSRPDFNGYRDSS